MSADVPLRITQAQISSWWFPRGFGPGDGFERFAYLIREMDDAYLPIRYEQIRRDAEIAKRKRQKPGPASVNGWSAD